MACYESKLLKEIFYNQFREKEKLELKHKVKIAEKMNLRKPYKIYVRKNNLVVNRTLLFEQLKNIRAEEEGDNELIKRAERNAEAAKMQKLSDEYNDSQSPFKQRIEKHSRTNINPYYSEKKTSKTIYKRKFSLLTPFQKNTLQKKQSRNIINIKKSKHLRNSSICMMVRSVNQSKNQNELFNESSNYSLKKYKSKPALNHKKEIQPIAHFKLPNQQMACREAKLKLKQQQIYNHRRSTKSFYLGTDSLLNDTKSIYSNKNNCLKNISIASSC